MLRPTAFVSAFRTPLLLITGLAALAKYPAVLRTLVVCSSRHNPLHAFFCAPPSHDDCFWYMPSALWSVPNAVRLLGYIILLLLLLEVQGKLVPARSRWRRAGVMAWLAMLVAAMPWVALVSLPAPTMRLLPVLAAYTAALWCFIIVNAELGAVERFVARRRWMPRVLEWTFPVSDLFCFQWHRQRMGTSAGLLRYVPMLSYLALLLLAFAGQAALVARSASAQKIPALAYDPYHVVIDEEGCWYAEQVGAQAGIWRYDAATTHATPVVRAQDVRSFAVEDGFLYLHDRFDNSILQVEGATRHVVWSVPVPRASGSFDIVFKHGLLIAAGDNGYLVAIDAHGRRLAERRVEGGARYPQILSDGQVTCISPGRLSLEIFSADLAQRETVPLPISGPLSDTRAGWTIPILLGSGYDGRAQMLYVATLWGDLLRYDVNARQWRAAYRTAPGVQSIAVDSLHGLLFVYNRVRGYVDVLDLASGKRRQVVLAGVLGNTISLGPTARVAVVSSRGPASLSVPQPGGLCRFDYQQRDARTP